MIIYLKTFAIIHDATDRGCGCHRVMIIANIDAVLTGLAGGREGHCLVLGCDRRFIYNFTFIRIWKPQIHILPYTIYKLKQQILPRKLKSILGIQKTIQRSQKDFPSSWFNLHTKVKYSVGRGYVVVVCLLGTAAQLDFFSVDIRPFTPCVTPRDCIEYFKQVLDALTKKILSCYSLSEIMVCE